MTRGEKSNYSFFRNLFLWLWRCLTFRVNEPAYIGKYIRYAFRPGDHFPSPKLWSFGRYNSISCKFIVGQEYHGSSPTGQVDKLFGLRGWPKRKELIYGISPTSDPDKYSVYFYVREGDKKQWDEIHEPIELLYGKEYDGMISTRKGRYTFLLNGREETVNEGNRSIYNSVEGNIDFPYFTVLLHPYVGGANPSSGWFNIWVKWFKAVKV